MLSGDSHELLTAEHENLKEAVIVRLSGEIDLSSVHVLNTELKRLAQDEPTNVIVDATKVTFMDSTGLHALVEGKRAIHQNGTRIYLVPSTQVRRVLELVFPDRLFADRLDSVEDALALIEARPGDS
jgi:anti-sigma B factor antagonist